jgi:hypothetical protein
MLKYSTVGVTELRAVLTAISVVLVPSAARAQPVPPLPGNPPVLWRNPSSIVTRDLFWGMCDETRAPQGPFTFVEEDTSGTQPKVVVTDRSGNTWDVKFGDEVHSEIAANRLVWALGYLGEELYFVREGHISAAKNLTRAAEHIGPDGWFEQARFRRRIPTMQRTDEEWTFKQNPFVGTREMSGLRILMTMIANWDIRGPRNNKVLQVTAPDGSTERWFIVSDLGGTFGRMGGLLSGHSKWNLKDFQSEGFIEKTADGQIHLDYDGWDSGIDRVPIDHARWFVSLAEQLTPQQMRRAFEAAGATQEEVEGFATRLLGKIALLKAALTSEPNGTGGRRPEARGRGSTGPNPGLHILQSAVCDLRCRPPSPEIHRSMKDISTPTRTGTALPSRRPGSKRQRLTALIAS